MKTLLWLGLVSGAVGCAAADGASNSRNPISFAGVGAGVGAAGGGGTGLSGVSGQASLGGAGAGGTPAAISGSSGISGTAGRTAAGIGAAGVGAAGGGGTLMTMGGSGMTGAGGSTTPLGGAGNAAMCPAAPAGASDAAIAALNAVNAARVPAGSGCIHDVLALNMSALNHCNYYAMYTNGDPCIADPHGEVMTCAGYTGAGLGERGKAVGYSINSEVMAFSNNPPSAVAQWINTVWHRIPLLDPWTGDMGYGGATRCDTIDLGRGTPTAPKDTVVVYPYNEQTGVPTLFNGANEGPMPPAPTTGWPSSTPINVYAQGIMVTDHILTLDGDTTPIPHVWLDTAAPGVDASLKGFLRSTVFMYANKPFTANTKYRVKIVGTRTGGTLNLEWTFTTGAANRF